MHVLRSCGVGGGQRRKSGFGHFRRHEGHIRSGLATVELTALLPLLAFMLVATVDYSRIFYYSTTLTNCARNGALYGRSSTYDAQSPYASLEAAALADSTNLQPAPLIKSTVGVDTSGQSFIEVTAGYQFKTLASYPGIPSVVNLERTVRMPLAPNSPRTP